MKSFKLTALAVAAALALTACGAKVDIPTSHSGKILTKDGYQEGIIPASSFRLPACWSYCDRLVLLDTSDKAVSENMTIFIPADKLNLDIGVRLTLSVNPKKTNALFGALPPEPAPEGTPNANRVSYIGWGKIYSTYAQQVVLTETREYLSKYSIAEISSSMEKVNADLRVRLQKKIEERTPFSVRYVGITNIKYPEIITQAQENAAQRREQVQQEEAQLQISKVKLERELQETRLTRQIELEKAQIEAKAQEIQKATVDEKVLALREIENRRAWIEKWDGQLPETVMGADANLIMQIPKK